MAKTNNPLAEEYLETRFSEIYGKEMAARIAEHIRDKSEQLREDPETPMQNTLNRLVYPFLAGMQALGSEGIPAEEASPLLMKMWEEMPEEIKLEGLKYDVKE